MPIEPTDPCPCGSGKKLKFCCSDLSSELQKIGRMLDGKQFAASLQRIESLEQEHPDRASLLTIKGALLRNAERIDDAKACAEQFRRAHPQNATALAESAIVAAMEGDSRAAMDFLQSAIAVCEEQITARVYDAIGVVAEAMLVEGHWPAARRLLQIQIMLNEEDSRAIQSLIEMNASTRVPLLLKDDPPLPPVPDEAPWAERFQEAMQPVARADFRTALRQLESLVAEFPDEPLLWRHVAKLRMWLADEEGTGEALHRFAVLSDDLEEAVEAEATAMALDDDPLGDSVMLYSLQWELGDVDLIQGELTLADRAVQVNVDPGNWEEDDQPPPKSSFVLIDRPTPKTADGLTFDNVPRVLGQSFVFGKQTDREARLETVGVVGSDLDTVKQYVGQVAGDALKGDPKEEELGAVSGSREILQRKWRLPQDVEPEQIERLAGEHIEQALLKQWPEMELGALDGRSPREAVGDESARIRVLAAILLLNGIVEQEVGPTFDCNRLRSELGLPILEPIDPGEADVATIPLIRLDRVDVEQAGDRDLSTAFRRASAYGVVGALPKLARAVAERESFKNNEDQIRACGLLARLERNPEQALKYVNQGREVAEAAGQSSARWDLMELSIGFALQDVDKVNQLLAHIQAEHLNEPGVAEAVTQVLMQAGVLRPDGSTAMPQEAPPQPAAAPATEEGASKLWTPDSESGGAGGKLWTPD